MEKWKPIPGYGGQYEASDKGNIRTVDFPKLSKKSSIGEQSTYIRKGKLLSKVLSNGYHVVRIKMKNVSVHRLAAITFLPNDDLSKHVNHIDGNKLNNNLENLEWVTCSENMFHAFKTGLAKSRKLSKEEIQALREKKYKKVKDLKSGIVYTSMGEAAKAKKISLTQLSQKLNGVYKNDLNLELI